MSATPAGPPPPPPTGEAALRRVRRRLRVAPRWVASLALLALVALAWGLWWATHRQFLATWSLNASGATVEWQLAEGHWKHGGTSHVNFRPDGWGGGGADDRELAPLLRLAHVQTLGLARCRRITDSGLAILGRLPELRTLDLTMSPGYAFAQDDRGTRLTDAALVHVAKLRDLEELQLNDVPITDAGLARLAGLANLRHLDLSGTRITDASLPLLESSFPALESLAIERTEVTNVAARRLARNRPALQVSHPANEPPAEGMPAP